MSKRDGKMYFAHRMEHVLDTSAGELRPDSAGYAGVILVFWTKTEARKHYGRRIPLTTIERLPDDE